MVLNNVTKFHNVVIKITGLKDRAPSKMVNFHEQRAITLERTNMELEKDIMVLNNVTSLIGVTVLCP